MRIIILITIFLIGSTRCLIAQDIGECPYPIVFVHGVSSNGGTWTNTVNELVPIFGPSQELRFELNSDYSSTLYSDDVQWVTSPSSVDPKCLYTINFEGSNGTGNQSASNQSAIVKQGYALKLAIDKIVEVTGKSKVLLVGHSMGGLASRSYLQQWADINDPKVAKLLTLGTPHLGANIAQNTQGIFVDDKSEASRDLAEIVVNGIAPNLTLVPGYFLNGSIESNTQYTFDLGSTPQLFHNQDVDANGFINADTDLVVGLNSGSTVNPDLPLPSSVKYTYYISNIVQNLCWPRTEGFGCKGDGVVDDMQMWLYEGSNGSTHNYLEGNSIPAPNTDEIPYRDSDRITDKKRRSHLGQTNDYKNIIRGLDEGDFPKFASEIVIDNRYSGFTQLRAERVAANSNIEILGVTDSNSPDVDCDWYTFTPSSSTNENYSLSIVKEFGQYYKADIFSIALGDFDNPVDGDVASFDFYPGGQDVRSEEIGTLVGGQQYYIRITSRVAEYSESSMLYEFKIHPSSEVVLSNDTAPHKPNFTSPLGAGLIRFVQNGEPQYNPVDGTWDLPLRAYNGYFEEFQVYAPSFPECDYEDANYVKQIEARKADITSIFKTLNAYTNIFGDIDSYSQELTANVSFTENTGFYIKFSDATIQEQMGTLLMPFVEPVISSALSDYFSNVTEQQVNKVSLRVYGNLLELWNNQVYQDLLTDLFTVKNVTSFRNALTGQLGDMLTDAIITAFDDAREFDGLQIKVNAGSALSFGLSQVSNILQSKISGSALTPLVSIVSSTLEGVIGLIDLNENQNLRFCLPIEYEDNLPTFTNMTPASGVEITQSTVDLSWVGFDADNDNLHYQLFVKGPTDSDFSEVSLVNDSSTNINGYSLSEPGVYQWYVVTKYSFNERVSISSNVGTFTYLCSASSMEVTDEDYVMGVSFEEENYDLIITLDGNFPNYPDLVVRYKYDDESLIVPESQVSLTATGLSILISNLPKKSELLYSVEDNCKATYGVFKPFPSFSTVISDEFCLAHFFYEGDGSLPTTISVNGQVVNFASIGDVHTEYLSGTGLTHLEIRYQPVNSALELVEYEAFTCVTENYECPLIDFEYQINEGDEVSINLNVMNNDELYYVQNLDGNSYLTQADNSGFSSRTSFMGFGSPEFNIVTSSPAAQGCRVQELVDEFLGLALTYMDDEMIEKELAILHALECNYELPSNLNLSQRLTTQSMANDIPSALYPPLDDIFYHHQYYRSDLGKKLEIFGSLANSDDFVEVESIVADNLEGLQPISSADSLYLAGYFADFAIGSSGISKLISRWNRSLQYWSQGVEAPTVDVFDIIIKSNVEYHDSLMQSSLDYAGSKGVTIDQLYQAAIDEIQNYSLEDDPNENAVCASVSINLSQTLTMTREAFEGTLTIFNGSTDGPMDSVELELIILDSDGVVSNDLFEIETTGTNKLTAINGTGVLAADTEGSASVLFIPEIGAAPTVPKPYSFGGNLSYIDPFSGLKVTMPLVPVALTVNPSPDLFLHYFLERDVLGDDLFTSEVEPSVPAKLGLMIENNGYGEATNVRIESAQPQVVDNEQGLALNMNLIGTRLEGQDATMGLANINFGNVDPLDTKVGEWLFTSDLLGHFTGYETNLIHSDSRGNPDLSLISGIELHELIRSINVYGGLDDNIEDFLVNEVPDANDHPDAIYLTQGNTVYDVAESFIGEFIGDIVYPNFTNTLSFDPVDSLWNYIKLDDPGNGNYDIVSVTRDSDGFLLPITNAWLTYVTIPDSKVQVYENKFHIVDDVLAESVQTYTVVWSPKDPNPPAVDTIIGAPSTVAYVPVSTLEIIFTEEINDSTFTYEDISLIRQGGNNLIDSTIAIVKIDSVSYSVDISDYTLEDGFYVFICQAAGVTDLTGSPGLTGKQVSWTQALAAPAIISFDPDIDGQVISSLDSLDLVFNIPIDTSSFDLNDVIITKDAVPLDLSSITLSLTNSQLKNFRLSDLASIINLNADYTIAFDLAGITSTTNKVGTTIQSISFTVDDIAPTVVQIEKVYDGGLDHQHVTGMRLVFSEEIESLTPASLQLIRDALDLSIQPCQVSALSNNTYEVYWTAIKSYADGNYDFGIDMSQIYDLAGNAGAGISQKIWLVDRIPSLVIDNLSITPDYGFSDSDALTYNRSFDLIFDINEYAQEIKIYQNDNGELVLLEGVDSLEQGSYSYSTTLLTGGNTGIKITALDSLRNPVEASLTVNIDESPLTGNWIYTGDSDLLAHPDSLVFVFNKAVLDTENIPISSIAMLKDNVPVDIGVLNIGFVNSTTLKLSNLNALPLDFGRYTLSIDLTQYHKYSSGISGFSDKAMSYTIFDPNRSPVAIASQDTVVQTGSTVVVSALASYDPDGDQLSYIWYAPDIVQLSDSTAASPSFLVTNDMAGLVLTLLLSVSDGSKVATDIVRVYVSADDIIVVSKVLLQGPYDPDLGKMNDLLRSQSHLPLEGPYTNEALYKFNDSKISTQIVFDGDSGNNIVDWVYLELVDMVNDSAIAGGMYLIKQEGQIVDADGFSPPKFSNIDEGSYSLAIYHRNHLPIRTNENLVIQANSLESIDLTQNVDQILGTINAVHQIAGTYTMIAGDVDENGQIQQSDINQSRPKIGVSGYHVEDVDMNGEIQNTDIQLKILPNLGRGKQF